MKRFNAFVLFALSMLACNASGQWESEDFAADNAALKKGDKMASPVTATDYGGSLPLNSILAPNDGDDVVAADVRGPVAALLAETDDIRNNAVSGLANKVDRTGDTMTGTLTITPSSAVDALVLNAATNHNAAVITGNGTAYAVEVTGGTANGAITAESNSGEATIEVFNASNGPGMTIVGSTSTAVPALGVATTTAQNATTPRMAISSSGFLALTGTNPNSNVDPGANNALHGANIAKAWVTIDDSYAILDGYNIASITHVVGSIYAVAFVRPMANANYGVKINVHGAPGYSGAHNGTKTTTGFQFVLFKTTDLTLGFGSATEAYIEVMGRQ